MFHFQRTYRFLANRAKNEALLRKIDISKWLVIVVIQINVYQILI